MAAAHISLSKSTGTTAADPAKVSAFAGVGAPAAMIPFGFPTLEYIVDVSHNVPGGVNFCNGLLRGVRHRALRKLSNLLAQVLPCCSWLDCR